MPDSLAKTLRCRGVIVDLDDTLYPEREYLLSGMRAVSVFAAQRLKLTVEAFQHELEVLLADPEGRRELFDRALHRFGAWSPGLVATLVLVFRNHKPQLGPFLDVIPALRGLKERGCLLGLVTDGPAIVQRSKFAALGLAGFFDALVFTDDLPTGCRKPSVVPFTVAAELLGLRAQDCAYVADDPAKDFLGPRELGMRTIRVKRAIAFPLQPQAVFPTSHEADEIVDSLEGAANILLS